MTKSVSEVGTSLHALVGLRSCGCTAPFFNVGLKSKEEARSMFLYSLIKKLPVLLMQSRTEQEARKRVEEYFEEYYLKEFFDYQVLYEVAKSKNLKKILRFVAYFFSMGYEIIATDVPYEVPVNAMYRGQRIISVYGNADMVLRVGEHGHMAVQFQLGEPAYSYSARWPVNMVRNSMELSSMYLGLSGQYEGLGVALYCLTHKDDRKDYLEDVFESRRGKNVVFYNYMNNQDALNAFHTSVAVAEKKDCMHCRYKSLCRLQEYHSDTNAVITEEKKERKIYSLTPSQERVMCHKEGPMAVIAVPGSGKTFSLVRRLEYLIDVEKVNPDEILFVTFTKKAADEIRTRVKEALGDVEVKNIHTFNSLGYSILREHPEKLGGRNRLAEKVDRYMLIEECLKTAPSVKMESYDDITGTYGLLRTLDNDFSFIEREGKAAFKEKYALSKDIEGILGIYDAYKTLYENEGYIDYDDQILLALELFKEQEGLLKIYQERFKYVMVDEFQDVSKEQCEMVYAIAEHGNIVVVGDDDQSIYGWRGGSNRFILDFQAFWKGAEVIIMEDNFRSMQPILTASNELIQNNEERYMKTIVAHKLGGSAPRYYRGAGLDDLVRFIAGMIQLGFAPGDMAVLGRVNKTLFEIGQGLEACGIKTMMPKVLVTEDAVFQTYLDLMVLYYEGLENDEALYRILVRLGCDFGKVRLGEGNSLSDRLIKAGYLLPVDLFDIGCLANYEEHRDESTFLKAGYKLVAAMKEIMYAGGIGEPLLKIFNILFEEGTHPTVEYLTGKAEEKGIVSVKELYEYMLLMLRYNDGAEIEYPDRKDHVNLLTAHKSKGREYPIVFVYGVEDYDDTEESRCLLYVAMTRAKKLLFMTEAGIKPAPLFQEIKDFVQIEVKGR